MGRRMRAGPFLLSKARKFKIGLPISTNWQINPITVKSTIRFVLGVFFSLLLMLSQSGCTYMLWSDQNYEAFHEPAPDPDLHLYQSKKQNDILVVYKEQSERTERIRTRAYWLNKNQIRVDQESSPIFINKKAARALPAVPIFDSMPTNEFGQSFYALLGTNQSFTLFSGTRDVGSYSLPVYDAGRPVAEKVALTPLTMTADAAIVAVVAGVIIVCAEASSN